MQVRGRVCFKTRNATQKKENHFGCCFVVFLPHKQHSGAELVARCSGRKAELSAEACEQMQTVAAWRPSEQRSSGNRWRWIHMDSYGFFWISLEVFEGSKNQDVED